MTKIFQVIRHSEALAEESQYLMDCFTSFAMTSFSPNIIRNTTSFEVISGKLPRPARTVILGCGFSVGRSVTSP